MTRTFFEHLGMAHLEKIHSQTICWMLSNDNKGISESDKELIIHDLFGVKNFTIQKVITEFESIDIVLISDDTMVCIENKVTSSVHSDQLARYEEHIKTNYSKFKHHYFLLLSLWGDTSKKTWAPITYSEFYEVLKRITLNTNKDGVIIQEYIATLERLHNVVQSFNENPEKYKNVFRDGSKRKSVKLLENQLDCNNKYISDNQLETIFQKLYYQKIADKLDLKDYYIFETRGNAALGVKFLKNQYYDIDVETESKKIDFGFDFQKGTFKIFCIATDYKSSKPEHIPNEIISLMETYVNKDGYTRKNKPKSKGQYSITKRRKEVIGVTVDEFSRIYSEEMVIAKYIVEKIIDNLPFVLKTN